jgi:hypothetical protein
MTKEAKAMAAALAAETMGAGELEFESELDVERCDLVAVDGVLVGSAWMLYPLMWTA